MFLQLIVSDKASQGVATNLCLQVNQPWRIALGHPFNTCTVVGLLKLDRSQDAVTLYLYLLREWGDHTSPLHE